MKKIFIIALTFGTAINLCFAQTKIEKYCEVNAYPHKIFEIGNNISINLGNPDLYFKDSTIKKNLLAVNNFKNTVDVLDYMSKLGWTLVAINSSINIKIFYFKKEFDKSEFTIDSN